MNKKIYNTPVVEQTEWLMTGMLCDSPGTPGSEEIGAGDSKPGAATAPKRPLF